MSVNGRSPWRSRARQLSPAWVASLVLVVATAHSSAATLVAGHYNPSDKFQHAIALVDGTLTEVLFDPSRGIFDTSLASFHTAVSVASFAASDGTQHAIVATAALRIFDVWWDSHDIHERLIATFRSTQFVQVTAFYSSSDKRKHVVTAIDTGDVEDLSWDKADDPIVMKVIARVPGVVGLTSFQ